MRDFHLFQPTYFAFGRDSEQQVGALVRRFQGSRVLLHFGGGSVKRSGLYDRVVASLEAEGIHIVPLGGVVPNPRSDMVYEGIRLCREEQLDFVLSIGGGSAIDSGKAIAAGALYDGDFWDFYSGKATPTKGLKHGCVLTLPATGTEGSTSSVVTHLDGMIKRGFNTDLNRPAFSILNPELTFSLPPYQTACGVVDMMAHIMERYFTNTKDVDLTDRLCEGTLKAIMAVAPRALENPSDYGARATLMWAGTIAHNGSLGVGREEDWASHNIEHELSALYDVAHGAGLAVVFPNWITYVMDSNVMRFAQFAVRVFNCELNFEDPKQTALEGVARLKAFFRSIQMPLSFEEIGAREEDIPLLTQKTRADKEGLLGSFVRLNKQDVEAIFRMCV